MVGRKRPARMPVFEQGSQAVIIFLTVCTKGRAKLLATSDAQKLILQAWTMTDRWAVGRYVIMPDHIHLFCSPAVPEAVELSSWVKRWKSLVSRSWPRRDGKGLWQESFWDTQLRSGESYESKWDYVRNNPVRHGLVATAESWAFQGELNILSWHEP